jgi:hypothetical protein
MDDYRIIDADYVFVGLRSDLAAVAPGVADVLRRDGLRMGLIMLKASAPLRPEIADLPAGVLALGVIQSRRTKSQITPALAEILRRAGGAPDWYSQGACRGFIQPGNQLPCISRKKTIHWRSGVIFSTDSCVSLQAGGACLAPHLLTSEFRYWLVVTC